MPQHGLLMIEGAGSPAETSLAEHHHDHDHDHDHDHVSQTTAHQAGFAPGGVQRLIYG